VITLDTSALYALLNRRDRAHQAAVLAFESDPGPYLVPAATLGEIAFLVEERLGGNVLDLLLADLESGRTRSTAARPISRALVSLSRDTPICRWDSSTPPSSPAPSEAAGAF